MAIKDLESLDDKGLEALDTKDLETLDIQSCVDYGYTLRTETEIRIKKNPENDWLNARRAEINNILFSFSGLGSFSETTGPKNNS